MPRRFVPVDRDQSMLVMIDFREMLGEDHLVWTLLDVIAELDLTELYARYGDHEEGGRPAYDPAMMLALLIYAYAVGIRGSRRIEQSCRTDWAFRAICGGLEPDHATIARFRVLLDDVLPRLFAEVVAICVEVLDDVALAAVDGTKIAAAAASRRNKTLDRLQDLEDQARAFLADMDRVDHDDETDPTSERARRTAADRLERIRQAKAKVQADLDAAAARDGERDARRQAAAERGRPPRPRSDNPKRRSGPPVANTTDPESRLVKGPHGFLQGYNAQTVVSRDQLVVAAAVSTHANDLNELEPMIQAAHANLAATGAAGSMKVALADAGYWSEHNAGLEVGVELLIATNKGKTAKAKPDADPVEQTTTPLEPLPFDEIALARIRIAEQFVAGQLNGIQAASAMGLSRGFASRRLAAFRRDGPEVFRPRRLGPPPTGRKKHTRRLTTSEQARQAMDAKLAEDHNRDLYNQRGWIVEGVYGQTKEGRSFRRFLRRGHTAVDREWKLVHIAGNIATLWRRKKTETTSPESDNSPAPRTAPTHRYHRLHPRRVRHTTTHPKRRCATP